MATKALYKRVEAVGLLGQIAAELLRAQKASSRAKCYRNEYSDHAYDRKARSLQRLCELLADTSWQLPWGWKQDARQEFAHWVLYVDLPTGQVSFHSIRRLDGPDYSGDWDQLRESEARIILFAQQLLDSSRIAGN